MGLVVSLFILDASTLSRAHGLTECGKPRLHFDLNVPAYEVLGFDLNEPYPVESEPEETSDPMMLDSTLCPSLKLAPVGLQEPSSSGLTEAVLTCSESDAPLRLPLANPPNRRGAPLSAKVKSRSLLEIYRQDDSNQASRKKCKVDSTAIGEKSKRKKASKYEDATSTSSQDDVSISPPPADPPIRTGARRSLTKMGPKIWSGFTPKSYRVRTRQEKKTLYLKRKEPGLQRNSAWSDKKPWSQENSLPETTLQKVKLFLLDYQLTTPNSRQGAGVRGSLTTAPIDPLREVITRLWRVYKRTPAQSFRWLYSAKMNFSPQEHRLRTSTVNSDTDVVDAFVDGVCWFRKFLGEKHLRGGSSEHWKGGRGFNDDPKHNFQSKKRKYSADEQQEPRSEKGDRHRNQRATFCAFYSKNLGVAQINLMEKEKKEAIEVAIINLNSWEDSMRKKVIAKNLNLPRPRKIFLVEDAFYNPPMRWAEDVVPIFVFMSGLLQTYLQDLMEPLTTQYHRGQDIQWKSWIYLQGILREISKLKVKATNKDFQDCFKVNKKNSKKIVAAINTLINRKGEKARLYRIAQRLLALWLVEAYPWEEMKKLFIGARSKHLKGIMIRFISRATMFEAVKDFVSKEILVN